MKTDISYYWRQIKLSCSTEPLLGFACLELVLTFPRASEEVQKEVGWQKYLCGESFALFRYTARTRAPQKVANFHIGRKKKSRQNETFLK